LLLEQNVKTESSDMSFHYYSENYVDLSNYNCAQTFQGHLPKIWIFATSLENCLICFGTLLFMLERHCYITDASITTFKSELFTDLVVLEARMFKIIANFAAENMGKKGVIRCGQVKNYYIA